MEAKTLVRVVVSTDDDEIAALARNLGSEVIDRPKELSGDTVATLPVIRHALDVLQDTFDAVCLLQPTTPFRKRGLIDLCVERLVESGADCVMTVTEVEAECNPHWLYLRDSDGVLHLSTGEAEPITRRQDLPTAFRRDGSVYVTRASVIAAGSIYGKKVVGIEVDATVNIDTEADWLRAEAMLESH